MTEIKEQLIAEMRQRVADKILERTKADLLIKLITNADDDNEALSIAAMGTTYKRTGLHFDYRNEKMSNEIRYFKKNEKLSFRTDDENPVNKLIIGDNYEALHNLLIEYKGKIDVIYIDPPYGKDDIGYFGKTNYENNITRDNLLSILWCRLFIAKKLLSKEGTIICSIDQKNHSYIKCLFDEIFGEGSFLFDVPRQTKKGGKTTNTIQVNHDYLLAYTNSNEILFSQEDKDDLSKYILEDKYVNERGKYKLTQTFDYNSLEYSDSMDYELTYQGRKFVPGGDRKQYENRKLGKHGIKDWIWRWSKSAFEWGVENDMFVLKGDRIYTKSYLKCRKKYMKNELEYIDGTKKAYTTLSFLDNENSNDNANKELNKIFNDGNLIFRNPKPSKLIVGLIKMLNVPDNALILDFFAGSGTTGHAVLDLNRIDNGSRTFILCQINERTDTTPNGIAYDVTSKRLKRIMTGECYDGSKDFKWIKDNEPYGGNLDVYEIESVANNEFVDGKTPFDVIDETLYGKEKFKTLREKVDWVCHNFQHTQKTLESYEEWSQRTEEKLLCCKRLLIYNKVL